VTLNLDCWEHYHCEQTECPAHGLEKAPCWQVSGAHCRAELEGTFLKKMEVCLTCAVFRSHVESPALSDTFAAIGAQLREYRRLVDEKIRALEELATVDAVTGLYNRRKFGDALRVEIERAGRYGQGLSVVMFDIDRFKEINDTQGHAAGDCALKLVAVIAQRRRREPDMLFRFGGDEFFLLLPQTALAGAAEAAEDLRQQIADRSAAAGLPLTASFGVAGYRAEDAAVTLLKRADQALYRAKEKGRNRVECEAWLRPWAQRRGYGLPNRPRVARSFDGAGSDAAADRLVS
jgi:diguanylate cyclase (GGDEF)-like protein